MSISVRSSTEHTVARQFRYVGWILAIALGIPSSGLALGLSYEVEEIGGGGWSYRYTLFDATEADFLSIRGFSVLFDPNESSALSVLPSLTPDWDVIAIQPDPLIPDFGALDALALVPTPDASVSFGVDFTFAGPGTPGSQFVIFYDRDFQPVQSSVTVASTPEPGLVVPIAGFSALCACGMKRRAT